MPSSDLSELVAGKSEDLGVEYKAWMDTSQPEVRAKLARHIAALSNHGGGYLIFGVDDTTRECGRVRRRVRLARPGPECADQDNASRLPISHPD